MVRSTIYTEQHGGYLFLKKMKTILNMLRNKIENNVTSGGSGVVMNIKNAVFHNCAVGDNAEVLNLIQSQQLKENIGQLLLEVQKIESDNERSQLNDLVKLFAAQIADNNNSIAQSVWNQIKEGLKTAGAATTIITAIERILGYIP